VSGLVDPSSVWAAGAVVSNVPDLMKWSEALASGALVSASSRQAQVKPILVSGVAGYGLGVKTFGGWVGHSGEIAGYESMMYTRPGVGTIVVLVNASTADGLASLRIFDAVRWEVFVGR
jgi:D-alanyl-D-alanine carboxypeptidase